MDDRAARIARLSSDPDQIEPGLRVFLDDAVGLEGRIDLVGRDRRGGVVVVGVAAPGDDLGHHRLVARYWRCGNNHGVTGFDLDLGMLAISDADQGRRRLSLAARGYYNHLFV